jgi:cytochrome c peroxidase
MVLTTMAFSFEDEKITAVKLGEKLFNEKILSLDSSVSCASCHKPEFAFADTTAFSIGINKTPTLRNTPSVLNMRNRPYFFWDGRAASLKEQALMPIENPNEMGLPIAEAVKRLNQSPYYKSYFNKVFGDYPNKANLAAAFAAFENSLETVNSHFDDWSYGKSKLTESEERGRELFVGDKAKCFDCHWMEDFTDDDFKNIGLFDGIKYNDSGRYRISQKSTDIGKFKTPGLRNVALTAPYMHNGIFKTLEEVIDFYNNPFKIIPNAKNVDSTLIQPLGLTTQEKKDLVAFLKTLSDKAFEKKN